MNALIKVSVVVEVELEEVAEARGCDPTRFDVAEEIAGSIRDYVEAGPLADEGFVKESNVWHIY